MAVWTGRMWNRFAQWLEDGPPYPFPPLRAQRVRSRPAYRRLLQTMAPRVINMPTFRAVWAPPCPPRAGPAMTPVPRQWHAAEPDSAEEAALAEQLRRELTAADGERDAARARAQEFRARLHDAAEEVVSAEKVRVHRCCLRPARVRCVQLVGCAGAHSQRQPAAGVFRQQRGRRRL
jgi:hypothetical protein